jgi:hypothetical protein
MPGITLIQAEEQLAAWLAASTATATGQSYSIAGRSLTRANANEIRDQIKFWDNQVKRLSGGGGIRMSRAVPVSKQ